VLLYLELALPRAVKKLAPIIDSMVIGQDRTFLRRNLMSGIEMRDEIAFDEFADAYVTSRTAATDWNPMICVPSSRQGTSAQKKHNAALRRIRNQQNHGLH
jgi:hypothetical protein